MKTHFVAACAVVAALVTLTPIAWVSAATPGKVTSPTPAELVTAALKTELDGPTEQREALLREALARDPDFAPARWQLGFVRWDDEWLALDEVAKRASGDERLTEYRKRRDRMIDTADAHRQLAIWCGKNRLNDEQRIHWAQVLEFNVQDAEALAALGLQLYEGRLLTKGQIVEAKRQAGERLRAMKHWQPRIVKWRGAIERGGKGRTAALEALRELSDPATIPALEATFAQDKQSAKTDELNLLLIETVSRMPFPEATQVLLRRAIVPDSRRVREAAADELKKRPMHAYVPQLIAALPGTIKTKFHIYVLPGGMVLHEHEVFLEGRRADVSLTYESVINPTDAITAMLITPGALASESQKAKAIEARAKAMHGQLEWLRGRVQFALERTTGFASANDPRLWERQYNDYYERYIRPQEKPHYQQRVENTQVYFRRPMHTERSESPIYRDPTVPYTFPYSCFPAGTQVSTLYGPRPIEQIRIGDQVLVMNVESGELSFRPVQARTLRPAVALLKLSVGRTTVSTTRGHPFWVNGEGWVLAKHLKVGQLLHSLGGSVMIRAIEEAPAQEAHNLIVGDAGTYFVGENALLVHDNTPLQESYSLVPGLSTQAVSP